ncbi:MAG: hypothetical protein WBB07_20840 [Mycobacterium sp.]
MNSDGNMSDWDAAYVLGALTPEERSEYEQLRAAEPTNIAALTDFADTAALLDLLSPQEALALLDEAVEGAPIPEVAPAILLPALAAAAEKRRVRSRRAVIASVLASAAAFLLIGGIIGYNSIGASPSTGVTLQAMAPGQRKGVSASLAVTGERWGTRLDWQCQYTKDWASTVTSYGLVVTTIGGAESTVATWSPSGHEASGLAAATVIPTSEIRSIEIRETGTTTPLAVTTLN